MRPVPTPRARPPRRLWSLCLGPLSLYAALWAALSWPAVATFSTHYICDGGDGMMNVWNLWWIRRAWEAAANPWFTDMLFWPGGTSLQGHTLNPMNGILGLPLHAFLGPIAVHNVLIAFAFATTGWTCFLLARHVSGSYWGALLGGAAFTFSHYHFAHAIGHTDLVTLQGVPLFALAFLRLCEAGGAWRGVGAALAFWVVVLCNWYYVLYCVLLGVTLALWCAVRSRRLSWWFRGAHARGLAAFVGVCLATSGPLVAALVVSNRADPLLGGHEAARAAMDVLAPFVPSQIWRFSALTRGVWGRYDDTLGPSETSSFLGWLPLVLAGYGLWHAVRVRRSGVMVWFWIGLLFLACALGPRLHAFGRYLSPPFPMPYSLLEAAVPPLRLSGMPLRMSIIAQMCVAVLAACGLVPFLTRVVRHRWLWPLLLLLLAFETLPAPQPTTRLVAPAVVYRLAELPAGAVHGLCASDGEKTYGMFFQTIHGKPITLGYIAREPASIQRGKADRERLERERRYAELMRDHAIRYLVRPAGDGAEELERDCARIWTDGEQAVWVLRDDPLAHDERMRVALAGPAVACERAGGTLTIEVTSPLDAGRELVLLPGAGSEPAQLWPCWTLPFAVDGKLARSWNGAPARGGTPFGGPLRFDASGTCTVRVPDPAALLPAGRELRLVAVTIASDPERHPLRLGPAVVVCRGGG
jgi:hypothetical protein